MLGLGFSSGIPFLLVYSTQSAWLSQAKVPVGTLGLLSELTLAYKFKFVWAPFLDRHDAPLFSPLLGRRRGWIILSQLAVAMALAGVALGDPVHWLAWTVAFSLALGFAGATLDVVIDGWRITAAPAERQALMFSWAEVGWRVGNFAAGAGALPGGRLRLAHRLLVHGTMASILPGTVFGSASHLSLAYLAVHGDHGGGEFWTFALTFSVDNFAYAFASIVLITYMSSLTTTEHAASQYALLTSLCALPGSLIAGTSGFVIEQVSFEWFFVATSLTGIPVVVLCWHVWHLEGKEMLCHAV